jgi:hypothetical protein
MELLGRLAPVRKEEVRLRPKLQVEFHRPGFFW